jgi:hypothetical protein
LLLGTGFFGNQIPPLSSEKKKYDYLLEKALLQAKLKSPCAGLTCCWVGGKISSPQAPFLFLAPVKAYKTADGRSMG